MRRPAAYPCASQPARHRAGLAQERNARVLADGAPGPTAGASTQVSAAPVVLAQNTITNYGWCDGVVDVWGYDFQPHATVRIELLSGDLKTVMDTMYATIDEYGYLLYQLPPDQTPYSLNLTYGYDGPVWVIVDEYYPFNQTTGAALSRACVYIGLRLRRYGPARTRYSAADGGCSAQPRGAAWYWAANAHAISDAPAATVSSPAHRTAGGILAGGPARPPSRDSSNGIAACIATAPSVQPSSPAALGMRWVGLYP